MLRILRGATITMGLIVWLMWITMRMIPAFRGASEKSPPEDHISSISSILVEPEIHTDYPDWWTPEHTRLLDAIRIVESGGDMNAVGDGGESIGAYQIQYVYWVDAVTRNPRLGEGFVYTDVAVSDIYARMVVAAYWDRYAKDKTNLEHLARIHNGGPRGHTKEATIPYWIKVQREMERLKNG